MRHANDIAGFKDAIKTLLSNINVTKNIFFKVSKCPEAGVKAIMLRMI